MASQIITQSSGLLFASGHASAATMGAIVIGLGITGSAVIALRSLFVAVKALAGLIIEGLKIVLIMLAAPVVLVLVLRSGHAGGTQSLRNSHATMSPWMQSSSELRNAGFNRESSGRGDSLHWIVEQQLAPTPDGGLAARRSG